MIVRSLFVVEGGEDFVLSPSLHSPPSRRAFATPESPPLSALEAPLPTHGSSRQVQPKKSYSGGVEAVIRALLFMADLITSMVCTMPL